MSPSLRRGRFIYFVIATLVIVDLVSSAAIAWIMDAKNFDIWRTVVFPGAVIYFVLDLWQGNKFTRWVVAIWALVKGGSLLASCAILLTQFAWATPPEQTSFFVELILKPFLIPLTYGGSYFTVGLMLLLSPSLKLFCEQQSKSAESVFEGIYEGIMGFFQKDRTSRAVRQFFREFENRTRYPILTREIAASLADEDLVDAIVDYVHLKIEGDYEHQLELIAKLPPGMQAVYRTWQVQMEVGNGGFHQYFYNKGIDEAFLALEGYKLLGEQETAALMARAIEISLEEEPEQRKHHTDDPTQMIDQYAKSREVSSLPELDGQFYELHQGDATIAYIRVHPEEFEGD